MKNRMIKIILVAMLVLCLVTPTMVVATGQSLSTPDESNLPIPDTAKVGYSSSETQNAIMCVQPSHIEVSQGDTFTIEIAIDPKDAAEIYGAQYDLYFEPDLLKVLEQTQGEFLAQDGADTFVVVNRINNTAGKQEYAESRLGTDCGVTSPGTLATVTFEVIGESGTSDLVLSDVLLGDPEGFELEVTANNSICTVSGYAPIPSPTPINTSPTISVLPSCIEASLGDTFTVEIGIDPKGAAEIYGAQFDLYFDSNLLNATLQSQGTFLAQDGATTIVIANRVNSSIGKIEYGEAIMGAEHGVTEPGVLASVTFEVVGTSGTSELRLSNVILANPEVEPVETAINSGTCTIATGAPTPTPAPTYTDFSAAEAHQMLKDNPAQIVILDVRTKAEYDAGHIQDAMLIPVSELENRIGELNKTNIFIVYCKSGGRSSRAGEILVQHGFRYVYNLLGGINAWVEFQLPVEDSPVPAVTPVPEQIPSDSLPNRFMPYRVPESINFEGSSTYRGYLNNRYGAFMVKRAKNVSEYHSYPRFVRGSYPKNRSTAILHAGYYIFR